MDAFPAVKFGSSTDQTSHVTGITCQRLEKGQVPGTIKGWYDWLKIAQLIEGFPF